MPTIPPVPRPPVLLCAADATAVAEAEAVVVDARAALAVYSDVEYCVTTTGASVEPELSCCEVIVTITTTLYQPLSTDQCRLLKYQIVLALLHPRPWLMHRPTCGDCFIESPQALRDRCVIQEDLEGPSDPEALSFALFELSQGRATKSDPQFVRVIDCCTT